MPASLPGCQTEFDQRPPCHGHSQHCERHGWDVVINSDRADVAQATCSCLIMQCLPKPGVCWPWLWRRSIQAHPSSAHGRLQEELEEIAASNAQLAAVWQGRIAGLEASLAAAAAPPPHLLAAVHELEQGLADMHQRLLETERQAEELGRYASSCFKVLAHPLGMEQYSWRKVSGCSVTSSLRLKPHCGAVTWMCQSSRCIQSSS